jgi:cell division protein FtsW
MTGDSQASWFPDTESGGRDRDLPVDRYMLVAVLGLVLFGLVMVYSASAVLAQKRYGSEYYFLIRQGIWAAVGLAAMTLAIKVDYRYLKQPAIVFGLLSVSLALLVSLFFFQKLNGTHRWITFGEARLGQPSEIAKVALIFYIAYFVDRRGDEINSLWRGFLPVVLVAAVAIGLIAAEPDLGTALAVGVIFGVVMFAAGVRVRHLAMLLVPAMPVLAYMLLFVPWRFQRVMDFMDPWKNQATSGFQTVQALIAIGSGGTTGLGLAEGKQKLFYLPAPHTDFIFAVIGEELGLIGSLCVVLIFAVLAWRGLKAAKSAPDRFGQLLAVGIATMIVAQAFFNMSVALALVPTKGIPLPFISSGGSSLAINLIAAGILLNISKHEASRDWA